METPVRPEGRARPEMDTAILVVCEAADPRDARLGPEGTGRQVLRLAHGGGVVKTLRRACHGLGREHKQCYRDASKASISRSPQSSLPATHRPYRFQR